MPASEDPAVDLLRSLLDTLDAADASGHWDQWHHADPATLTAALEQHADDKQAAVAARAAARAWLDAHS